MDALAEILGTSRIEGSIFCRARLSSPWSIALEAAPHVGVFHMILAGMCWLELPDENEPVRLLPGDVILLPHGDAHTVTDSPGKLPIPLDDLLTNCEPGPALEIEHGGGGAETHILSGAYRFDPDESHPVFGYLPTVIHRAARLGEPSTGAQAALQLLSHELEEQRPGYQAVVDRLVDMVFIFLVRSWIESQPEEVKGWLAALRHPQIGDAICLLHRRPHDGWTVGSLARSVGMSRSAFARDFKALTGESPLAYVTHWRMETAARLLRSTSEPLASIADRVGYESEYSFGKAFRRIKGVAPGRYRAAVSRRSRPEANRRTARGDGSDDERPRRTAAHPSRRA